MEQSARASSTPGHGVTKRQAKCLDFAFVVIDVELRSHYKPFALGVLSRSVNVAVIPTVYLDPQTTHSSLNRQESVRLHARCLQPQRGSRYSLPVRL